MKVLQGNIAYKQLVAAAQSYGVQVSGTVYPVLMNLVTKPENKAPFWKVDLTANDKYAFALLSMKTGSTNFVMKPEMINCESITGSFEFNGVTYSPKEVDGMPSFE